jgi:general secretion pathway protein D
MPASAQTEDASLVRVTLADTSPVETHLVLTFSGSPPPLVISGNDSGRPAVILSRTGRSPGANSPSFVRGLVRDLGIEQRGADLALLPVGPGAMHVEATAVGGQTVFVTVRTAGARGPAPGPARVEASSPATATSAAPLAAFRDPASDSEEFAVVPLKYADVSEIVGLLSNGPPQKPNDTFIPQEPAFGSSGMTGGANTSYQQNPALLNQDAPPIGAQVDEAIGIDRRLNAVILRGPAERIRRLRDRIALLDVPVNSVLLETVFVELTDTAARNVGIDFKNSGGKFGIVTVNSGAFTPGGGLGGNGLSNAGQTSAALQAAIFAQVAKGEGRIISRPRISAQSGSSAKIITGDALPILTSIALSGVNAVSQQVQYVNVGVTLQIAPRVSDDGHVTSHVFCEVSSVTGYSQGYPTISQREASTTATVLDGEFFVIGGLTQENRLTTREGLPGLSRIPALGELFKLHMANGSRTQLYIVVTPHIAKPGDSPAARALTEK